MKFSTLLLTFCGASLLAFFYAATLSAAELSGQTVEAASLRIESGKVASGEALAVITAVDSKGYAVDYKSAVIAPTSRTYLLLLLQIA